MSKKCYYLIYLIVNICSFYLKLNKKNSKKILVLDIDNTLTYTWEYLHLLSKNNLLFLELPLKNGTIKFVKSYSDDFRLFLTARSWEYDKLTKQYLAKNNLLNPSNSSVICMKPKHKVLLIRILTFLRYQIAYVDDLSYNHENGFIKFYSKEIEDLNKLNIDYFNYNFLNFINNESQIT
jgi:hypothetical protein